MYNGVGIVTPRGSGTSGHVQRNVATVRVRGGRAAVAVSRAPMPRDPAADRHALRRKVELRTQEWARAEKIRERFGREEAAKKIGEKRAQIEREMGVAKRQERAAEAEVEEGEVVADKADQETDNESRKKRKK